MEEDTSKIASDLDSKPYQVVYKKHCLGYGRGVFHRIIQEIERKQQQLIHVWPCYV